MTDWMGTAKGAKMLRRMAEEHQRNRCERCYGDVRGECIRAGRCIFGLSQKCIQIGDKS